jgi:hypothetical protein
MVLLETLTDFAANTAFDKNLVIQEATGQAINLAHNPIVLVVALILIIVSVLMILHLKKIIMNSILGGILWAISVFIFNINLPPLQSFVVSVIFGPAGIGVMLVLKFFGLF